MVENSVNFGAKVEYVGMHKCSLCVDNYHSGEISGRIYDLYSRVPVKFSGYWDVSRFFEELPVDKVESRVEEILSGEGIINFIDKRRRGSKNNSTLKGRLATFAIELKYINNGSAGGRLYWFEGGKGQFFRSFMELIYLIDEACAEALEKL